MTIKIPTHTNVMQQKIHHTIFEHTFMITNDVLERDATYEMITTIASYAVCSGAVVRECKVCMNCVCNCVPKGLFIPCHSFYPPELFGNSPLPLVCQPNLESLTLEKKI